MPHHGHLVQRWLPVKQHQVTVDEVALNLSAQGAGPKGDHMSVHGTKAVHHLKHVPTAMPTIQDMSRGVEKRSTGVHYSMIQD